MRLYTNPTVQVPVARVRRGEVAVEYDEQTVTGISCAAGEADVAPDGSFEVPDERVEEWLGHPDVRREPVGGSA